MEHPAMPDEKEGSLEANANASASQQPPPPLLQPLVEGKKKGDSADDASGGNHIQKTKIMPEHWANSVQAVCTVLIVLITAYYTRAAFRQAAASETAANAARDAVGIASRTLCETQRSNLAQEELSEANRTSAEKTASDSLNATIKIARQDQRAWVGLIHTETLGGKQSKDGNSFSYDSVRVAFRNSGKTPALKVSVQRTLTVGEWGYALGGAKPLKPPDFDEQFIATERFYEKMTAELVRENPKNAKQIRKAREGGSPAKTLSAISPSGRSIAPAADLIFEWPAIGLGSLRDTKTGAPITTYLLGKITYNDIFPGTKRHTTKFCLMWYENGFTMCDGGGNRMD
jgi:hypothetical protein